MNDPFFTMPERLVQAVGLACTPATDPPPSLGAAARLPIAAAIITLRQRGDGHVELIAEHVSDLRPAEFPLPHLIEERLAPGALTLVSAADRVTLGVDAAARRYFLEPRLAAVVHGERTLDPAMLLVADNTDEKALCRRLSIPTDHTGDANADRLDRRDMIDLAEKQALARAVSRLMLWSTAAAFASAEPALFFEPMLALRAWLDDQADAFPALTPWAHSRPIMRAVSFAARYHENMERRLGGEDVGWTEFRDGLFHS